MIEGLLHQIEKQEDVRANLSAIRAAIREKENFDRATELIGDGEQITALLSSEDPKVRKNAAALLGDLGICKAAEALFLTYQKEDTLFVRGTLLTALEKTNPTPYLNELQNRYQELCQQELQENEKKHVREELHALERILRSENGSVSHTFIGWKEKVTILLTTNPNYRELTASKLQAYRKGYTSLGVKAVVDDLREVVKIRTFRELLFPIRLKEIVTVDDKPEKLGQALAEAELLPFIERCHKQPAPFFFRVEMRNGLSPEERSRYVKRMAAALEEKTERKLLNSANEYEFELRLFTDKEGKYHVFLKMNTIPMERFSYRKEAIASSMHPSSAAMLMELCRPYLKERAQILDPCCGVGTMLVERNKILPAREIYGIDIFGEAVDKAKRNCEAAGMHVNFIHRDYLDFKHKYLFDEIIANMPVRGKRTREEQDAFYSEFFRKSEELLAPEGVLILYSNENGFVKKQLRLHQKMKLYQEYVIRDRGQFVLYIIGVR